LPAYQLYGAADHLGIHYSHHAHAFTDEDWTALMDFGDKYVRGMAVAKTFDHFLTMDERNAAKEAAAKAVRRPMGDAMPGTGPE
jgi:hypothetical protein